MKPRIIRYRCIKSVLGRWPDSWACYLPAPGSLVGWKYPWGCASTPDQAYRRWKRAYDKATSR